VPRGRAAPGAKIARPDPTITCETRYLERAELHRLLVNAVFALPEPYRGAVLWRYFEGLDAEEIAGREGISPVTARTRLKRGLDLLREKLDRDSGGRDHWSNAMSVLFAGCGTPGGQVVGATDPRGYAAVDRILSPENFASTVYTKLGIDPDKIFYTPDGRPVHLVSDPAPIPELCS